MGRDRRNGRKSVVVPEGGWQAAAKKPVLAVAPAPAVKRPVLDVDNEEVLDRRLVWRFNEIDSGGPWPPAEIGSQDLANLLRKMADFETMTLRELFAAGSEHGKRYDVTLLPAHTRKRLEQIERDDETEIARLRCGGAPRLYGFLRENVFHVVWWDAKHAVYPSKKKHT